MLDNELLEKEIVLRNIIRQSRNAFVASTLKRFASCETRQQVGAHLK
jgi:hypothetical protein